MKEKDRFYGPQARASATVDLRTMALFERNTDGYLVYARKLVRRWRKTYPTAGERRARRRIEWRKDVMCRVLSSQRLGPEVEARTCNLSRGGVSLLLAERVNVGSYIDFIGTGDRRVALPVAEVLNVQPRGDVWLVSGRWRGGLDRATFRKVLGRRAARASHKRRAGEDPGWLMSLWQKFLGAAA
ncbi:hypothetical protein AYO44_10130 [Planctomycetaceae bacterium SCGC AG-212-F19]|nr:hypothetical protein AYO44_10130 [Planctomycetaceae bacterium SCGC AG-212-F19]